MRSRAKCVLSQIFTSNTRIKNENTADDNEQLNSKQIHKKNKWEMKWQKQKRIYKNKTLES